MIKTDGRDNRLTLNLFDLEGGTEWPIGPLRKAFTIPWFENKILLIS